MLDAKHTVRVDDDDRGTQSSMLFSEMHMDNDTVEDVPNHISTVEEVGQAEFETAAYQALQWVKPVWNISPFA